MRRFGGFCAVMLALCVAFAARAETVETVFTEVGDSHVSYPVLSGLADEALQRRINDDIVEQADIAGHLLTLGTLTPDGLGLTVDETHWLSQGILSVVLSAKGKMPNGREGQQYTALCYDLETGERVAPEQLFIDVEAASGWMGDRLEATYADELSGYLENGDLTPIPVERFSLDEYGIAFYYPSSQFSLLSGYSGACQFHYSELTDFLDLSEGSVLSRLGVKAEACPDDEVRRRVEACVAEGRLPDVPVAIGDSLSELIAKYRLLREPDQYPGGRYFPLEAPIFRQVLLMTDALTKGYERSIVQGIHSTRTDLFGIRAGVTEQARWRELLGQPEVSVALDESEAYDYALPAGESDYYPFAGYRLRLHADTEGILYSVTLSK